MDWNNDGKHDFLDSYLDYYMIYGDSDDEHDDDEEEDDDEYEWRLCCEDGSDYDIDPEDYETKEEYEEALKEAKYGWRKDCEDGSDYDIDPEDYETEEEYEEALEEAKYGWREECEDGSEYDIDPEDYETEEEYEEALEEAKYSWQEDCEDNLEYVIDSVGYEVEYIDEADYIIEGEPKNNDEYENEECIIEKTHNSEEEYQEVFEEDEDEEEEHDESYKPIPKTEEEAFAIKYLSNSGDFLYAQAIKDNFEIPCYLPSEKKKREIEFTQIIMKIAKKNIPLSFEIWSWCLKKFGPYSLYDNFVKSDLSKDVIDELYAFPDEYITKLVYYMTDNPDFCKTIIVESNELIFIIPELIEVAINEKLYATAENIFKIELEQLDGRWEETNKFIECVIYACENYDEHESMVYFRDNLFPYVKTINDGMVQDEIDDWEKEITNYIEEMKEECQEEFNRENIWRELVSEANKNILDPSNYATREDYYEELNAKLQQIRQQEIMQQQQEYLNDKTIYTYCGVLLPFSPKAYSYRTEDETIQIGDTVVVPVGEDDEEKTGTVVSIGKYARVGVPYPVEKTKFILRKENE